MERYHARSYEEIDQRYPQTSWSPPLASSSFDGAISKAAASARFIRRSVSAFQIVVIIAWTLVLYWGERYSFDHGLTSCQWDAWEQWPSHAQPHHVVFLADPQLVDPHTYPGRPWPLSSLTVSFTDKYLKRGYRTIQRDLDPDTVYFLGDLFDGGREWRPRSGEFKASEKQWEPYGMDFWLHEYNRFGRIFFEPAQVYGESPTQRSRRVIASLPGNHDLGFGIGIQPAVKARFQTFFGNGDRVDIIGNHTFVGLDTVSLSAMDTPGSAKEVWQPSKDFLDDIHNIIAQGLRRELLYRNGQELDRKHEHVMTDPDETIDQLNPIQAAQKPVLELPKVLLTHVPFYRDPGTPCGPQRERHPPSAPDLEKDEPNAIRVAAGYQYQNVLTHELSKTIAEKVGNIGQIFSGDDHDYCEVTHRAYPSAGSGIKEITVKSMSLAMGVRRPGFLLASLWNPIDGEGHPLRTADGNTGDPTIQTHLCLLPDQLSIFIKYALCFVVTLVAITVHSTIMARREKLKLSSRADSPILPTAEPLKATLDETKHRTRASSVTAHSSGGNGMLAPRSQSSRTRSVSPAPFGQYALPNSDTRVWAPLIEQAGYYGHDETDDWGHSRKAEKKPASRTKRPQSLVTMYLGHWVKDLASIACPILVLYWWLLQNG